ncbi:hypothetical protein B0H19DRAFT_1227008, partial [Mycena capillaripes]
MLVIRKSIHPLADCIMTLILLLIQSAGKTLTVLEDAMDCAGAADEAPDTKGNERDPAIGVRNMLAKIY